MNAEDFVSRLDGVEVHGDGAWMATCPAHGVMEAVDAEQEDIPHFGAAIRFAKSSIKTRIAALVGKS